MANAELRQENVDCSRLNTATSTLDAELGCGDVIVTIWNDEGQSPEPLDDFALGFWLGEALQQFLQY